jgi:hypothetical protein
MADPSLAKEAIDTLDEALRERDPLTRMMLMERALTLHRKALRSESQAEPEPRSFTDRGGPATRPH